ncbi:uncharacterized protein LOC128261217 [Drosophila gunungcola]|uniref:Uncharacterized protein n=1 Tax=Drosophila gunungcola TaxID=103775 RepID=A0A9P9YU15_9MUSC|nr:uncharacterized protein LOC128261217 [Drosophila gunungcola]KAI8042915.1 hypothetical protein M5D96_004238 [Drosophila gunungcola]
MSDKKASSSRGHQPGIQFSTAMGTPETKRKMLLYRRLLSRELARDGLNAQEIVQARNRSLRDHYQGRFPKS